ncbi:MAG: Crp/Fnr family transcriptional regulator, partial [Lachnospiraceae bacterium]|nr:Crp/Fnr family transcriptional regulator [Lachnospiraceae bacterium]
KFMEDGLLTKEGKQIVINRQQYEGLKRMVSEKVDLE